VRRCCSPARGPASPAEPPWWQPGEVVLSGRVLGSSPAAAVLDPESALLLELDAP
jgi:hypothetical protein